MEQNFNKKAELKDKLITFYKENKLKIYFSISVLIFIFISIIFINLNNEKKNNLISEKYIQAGLYLASDNKEKSSNLYKEII